MSVRVVPSSELFGIMEREREDDQDLKSFVIHMRELSDFQEPWEEK